MEPCPAEKNGALESILLEFEQDWFENPSVKVEDYVPHESSENYVAVLTELARSEMELRSEAGVLTDAKQYFDRFPALRQHADARQALVFEEYRLRNGRGDRVAAQVLASKYGIDSTDWPELNAAGSKSRIGKSMGRLGSAARQKIKFPEVGDTFEDFLLVGQLGEGAFGRVFLAQQGELESRFVVLKFTSIQTDEHRLLAQLQHTHIVPIHSVHRLEGMQAICMPLLGLATLEDMLRNFRQAEGNRGWLQSQALVQTVNRQREQTVANTITDQEKERHFHQRQRLSAEALNVNDNSSIPEFAATFMAQVAEGLGYAHQRGIVHGDLKPANLLVNDDGEAVILDFHLGHAANDNIGSLVGGTLPYMAPEHLRALSSGEMDLKPTMDVYAAGVILFEILSGRWPHNDALNSTFSPDRLAESKEIHFRIPKDQRFPIGEDLSAIIEVCLDPIPTKRYQNGSQLAAELHRFRNHQPLLQATNGSIRNRVRKWSRRNPRLSSASTILVACSLVILVTTLALWTVSSQLNRLHAVSESERHIELSGSIRPALATAQGLHDGSFFTQAIDAAETVIRTNSWQDLDSLQSRRYFGLLDQHAAAAESIAAAELHFWLAEIQRKPDLNVGDQSSLTSAAEHNRLAATLWPTQQTSFAIEKQKQLIQAALDRVEIEPDDPQTSRQSNNRPDQLLSACLQQGDALRKEKMYRKLAEQDPDDFLTWLLLGNACADQGKFEQAEAYFTVSGSIDSQSNLPALYRGILRMEQGKLDLALEDFEKANQLSPNDVTTLLNHALALGKKRDFAKALAKYDRAIELGATQTRVWFLRSRLKKGLGDDAGADADYALFMSMQPTDEKSCIIRGVQKIKTRPAEAIEDFQAALRFDPQSFDAFNNIAHVYSEELGETEKAIEYMDQAVACNSINPQLRAARGVLHARLGNATSAIADAEAVLRMDQSADTQYRVAGIYAQLSKSKPGYAKTAIGLLAKAAFKDPGLFIRLSATDPDIAPIKNESGLQAIFAAISDLKSANSEKNPK